MGLDPEVMDNNLLTGAKDLTIDVNYIIATQLGGLIVADNSNLKGTDQGNTVAQQTDSIINSFGPVRPVPKK